MNTSVIVIHETNNRYNYESVRDWFASSDFEVCEAVDLFDAIDKMSDFTDTSAADIFLVKLRPGSLQDRLIREFDAGVDCIEIPIAILSDQTSKDERRPFNFGNVRGLKAYLDSPKAELNRVEPWFPAPPTI